MSTKRAPKTLSKGKACSLCHNGKLKCTGERPCARCIEAGTPHLCVDRPQQARGPYKTKKRLQALEQQQKQLAQLLQQQSQQSQQQLQQQQEQAIERTALQLQTSVEEKATMVPLWSAPSKDTSALVNKVFADPVAFQSVIQRIYVDSADWLQQAVLQSANNRTASIQNVLMVAYKVLAATPRDVFEAKFGGVCRAMNCIRSFVTDHAHDKSLLTPAPWADFTPPQPPSADLPIATMTFHRRELADYPPIYELPFASAAKLWNTVDSKLRRDPTMIGPCAFMMVPDDNEDKSSIGSNGNNSSNSSGTEDVQMDTGSTSSASSAPNSPSGFSSNSSVGGSSSSGASVGSSPHLTASPPPSPAPLAAPSESKSLSAGAAAAVAPSANWLVSGGAECKSQHTVASAAAAAAAAAAAPAAPNSPTEPLALSSPPISSAAAVGAAAQFAASHSDKPPTSVSIELSSSVQLSLPGAEMVCLINGEWERLCACSQRDVSHDFVSWGPLALFRYFSPECWPALHRSTLAGMLQLSSAPQVLAVTVRNKFGCLIPCLMTLHTIVKTNHEFEKMIRCLVPLPHSDLEADL